MAASCVRYRAAVIVVADHLVCAFFRATHMRPSRRMPGDAPGKGALARPSVVPDHPEDGILHNARIIGSRSQPPLMDRSAEVAGARKSLGRHSRQSSSARTTDINGVGLAVAALAADQ